MLLFTHFAGWWTENKSSKCSSQLNQVYPPAQPFAQVSTTVQFHSDAFLHQIKIDFKSGNYLISYE